MGRSPTAATLGATLRAMDPMESVNVFPRPSYPSRDPVSAAPHLAIPSVGLHETTSTEPETLSTFTSPFRGQNSSWHSTSPQSVLPSRSHE
nr:hypothetical protein CFP56_00405 [Quercus suber]